MVEIYDSVFTVTWRDSYTMEEITQMRCEIVALSNKLYVRDEWNQDDKNRFDNLRKCLSLLGFNYRGGDCFELTDGTDLL